MNTSLVRGVTAPRTAARSTWSPSRGTSTGTAARFCGSRTKLGKDGHGTTTSSPDLEGRLADISDQRVSSGGHGDLLLGQIVTPGEGGDEIGRASPGIAVERR